MTSCPSLPAASKTGSEHPRIRSALLPLLSREQEAEVPRPDEEEDDSAGERGVTGERWQRWRGTTTGGRVRLISFRRRRSEIEKASPPELQRAKRERGAPASALSGPPGYNGDFAEGISSAALALLRRRQ